MSLTIDAQLPGTFYHAPKPGDPPFVSEGDAVVAGQTIGLIEVMKNFAEIQAESAGTVVRILVEDGALVDVGQPIVELSD